MKNSVAFLFLLLLQIGNLQAQRTDKALEKKIHAAIAGFQGEFAFYSKHLKQHKEVAINADELYPTASVVKIPILVGVFQKIANGELRLDQQLTYRDSRAYGGSGIMQFYKDSTQTDLATLIGLMLSYSDNVTSIWCQELAGGGLVINPIMESLDLKYTKVNSRTAGREEDWKKYGWGQTTAREMSQLLEKIRLGKVISPQYSDKMYRFLKNQFYNGRSLSQFPAEINCISKTGSLEDVRTETVLVNAPHGDFVFTLLTKNNKDQSWDNTNEAEILTRKIANIIWNHYEENYTPYPPVN
ncbi:serine hydrolase [Sphingobacterium lactis]|uniref:serine hydrolase n=1 Tax=Sphingobacterium lactis TaxID=797291 RepID=UPI003EC888C1